MTRYEFRYEWPCRRFGRMVQVLGNNGGSGTGLNRRHQDFRNERIRARLNPSSSASDGKDPPWVWDTLQGVGATIFELDAGSGHKVLRRGRDEDLTGRGQAHHPGADVDGQPADAVLPYLHLASVQ